MQFSFRHENHDIPVTLLEGDEPLLRWLETLTMGDYLVVDTEFVRTDSFYPKAGLLQLAYQGAVWLIDPLSLKDLTPLRQVFYGNRAPRLVFHSCSEDIEVFKRLWNQVPLNVFDTQIAAGFISPDRQPGLGRLVESCLNISLPKDQTRSDWLARPLSRQQLEYAALDVFYLEKVYPHLIARLEELGRTQWVEQECQQLVCSYQHEIIPEQYYKKIGEAWRLAPEELRRLQILVAWRERYAQEHDIARNLIARDDLLIALAKRQVTQKSQLQNIKSCRPAQIRKYGAVLLEQAELADQAHGTVPEPVPKPYNKETKKTVAKLKGELEHLAQELNLAPERLASKKQLERFVAAIKSGSALPHDFSGWRAKVVVPRLMNALADP